MAKNKSPEQFRKSGEFTEIRLNEKGGEEGKKIEAEVSAVNAENGETESQNAPEEAPKPELEQDDEHLTDSQQQGKPTHIETGKPAPPVLEEHPKLETPRKFPSKSPSADSFKGSPKSGVDPQSQNPSPASRHSRSASVRRSRNASVALAHDSVNGAQSQPAKIFIQSAFEKIKVSKDAKRIPALFAATNRVLERFTQFPDQLPPPKVALEPLRLVCVPPGTSNELKEIAIDALGQLFSFNFMGTVEDEAAQNVFLAEAVDIVCDAWEAEGAEQRVEVQIIKALTAAVVNEDLMIHGSVLMRAVRQVYHIFVVTRSQSNQSLAQVSLTQMVQAVFERVRSRCMPANTLARLGSESASATSINAPVANNRPEETEETEALTLQTIQNAPLPDMEDSVAERSELENITQDAGLLFRTLCRLSMKTIDENDVKSQPMRSKLLSLHLIHMILKHNISVLKNKRITMRKSKTESEPLALAIKPYLRQAMAQNALSSSPAAFEITAEIFWLVLANLRGEFKPELAVFFTEVYFTAMDMKTASMHQRLYFMTILSRICTDPRLLVELYLNYDCDPAAPNVFEKLMEQVSRIALKPAVEPLTPITRLSIDRQQIRVYDLNAPPAVAIAHLAVVPPSNSSMLTSAATIQQQQLDADQFMLKAAALEAMVNILRSLILWSQRGSEEQSSEAGSIRRSRSGTELESASDFSNSGKPGQSTSSLASDSGRPASKHRNLDSISSLVSNNDGDDPSQFANRKQSKRILDASIQEFNFHPSRGLRKFVEAGLLKDECNATEVANLLLKTDGLDKAQLGDYLGKNHEFNQKVMSEFVYAMDFRKLSFVGALRSCLQRFRLPGEGQVIDRYMQTFAKKYFDDTSENGVHADFASADSAWVLAMSVMMLNTDLHASALRRRRMTDDQFIKNNKGMNDGVDFRAELLMDIYREIQQNEIKLDSEQNQVAIKDEAYNVATGAITSRATQFFQDAPPLEFADYYNASHAAHIRPMFDLSWLAVLAGISNPFNQLKDPMALNACLEGLELALRIACHFDVAIARVSFVQTLSQATLLWHPESMTWKNVGAIHALFRVANTEGDAVRESWYDVLQVVSQLEKVQLVARGSMTDSASNIPHDIAEALLSRELIVDLDRIFANTQNMTNEGAVHFVKALSRVSLEEIDKSSGEPRLFALQKMVDVCYYNSVRIRMGWSELWDAAMAEQFAKVLTYNNTQVVMFALDSLRQLSMRFLEIDEMPHFAFQKEFLQPFSHALAHNKNTGIRVLALECLQQMAMTRSDKVKSGWEAIFNAVKVAANAEQPVVEAAFTLLSVIPTSSKVPPGFLDACSAIAEQPEAKTALKAVELLHQLIASHPDDKEIMQNVFVYYSQIAMQGRDLEVRGRCLEVLFKLLNDEGHKFSRDDWDEVFTRSLGPLFSVLHGQAGEKASKIAPKGGQISPMGSPQRSPQRSPTQSQENLVRKSPSQALLKVPAPQLNAPNDSTTNSNAQDAASTFSRSPSPFRQRAREEMSLWLSSTLIQALKSLVSLFGTYFDMLEHALDPFFLELLRTCILQENDPVSRMGNSCLQILVHDNAERFTDQHWNLIVSKIVQIFKDTTATLLRERSVFESSPAEATDCFRSMTAKTMQALLVIGTVRELLVSSQRVFNAMPVTQVLRITTRLRMSYTFAREFNMDNMLRHELYQRGFFRQTPNLLHQESQAAQTYVSISMRLFKATERFAGDPSARQDVSEELMPFCAQTLTDYNRLKETEPRHISKLLPIVESALRHIVSFEDDDFKQLAPSIYMQVVEILNKNTTTRLREDVQGYLRKVGYLWVLPVSETKK